MALTPHERKHVLALRADAADQPDRAETTRIRKIANDLLAGRSDWPVELLKPYEIHDWAEVSNGSTAGGSSSSPTVAMPSGCTLSALDAPRPKADA